MRLVGFNFTKINAEKFSNKLDKLKIETSINLDSIEEIKNELLKTKDIILNIKFNYIISYEPKIAKIDLGGSMTLSVDSKQGKEILKKWKTKKLEEDIRLTIFNVILMKSNVKAIQLEDEMILPTHFKLPSLKPSKKE